MRFDIIIILFVTYIKVCIVTGYR